MSGESQFGVEIVAEDETAKGFASAEKRAQAFATADEKRRRTAAKEDEAHAKVRAKYDKDRTERLKAVGLASHGKGFAAAERAFGGGALSATVGRPLRDLSEAGSTIRSAFAAATHESAGLTEKFGALGLAATGAAGAVIGLSLGAAKLAASWVQGAAGVGRTAGSIGMSTDDLQRWEGAGERFGVDKNTMAASLAGIGSTVHEAIYGRNNEALAGMNQLGIGVQRTTTGAVDVSAMARQVADAIARQTDAQTQGRIASQFGVSPDALPAFRQGAAAMRAQGDDFAKYGGMVSPDEVGLGTRLYTKGVQLRQMGEHGLQAVQSATARAGEGLINSLVDAGHGAVDAAGNPGGALSAAGGATRAFVGSVEHTFAPAVMLFDKGAHDISVSAERLVAFLQGRGLSHTAAVGMAANAYAESGLNAHRHQKGGPAYGLFQWESARRSQFKALTGHDLADASWQEQADFAVYELNHSEKRAARKLAMAKSYAEAGADGSLYYDRPKDAEGQARYRAGIAEQIGNGTFDHRHKVDVEVHDKRTTAKVTTSTAGASGGPAVGYASVGGGL